MAKLKPLSKDEELSAIPVDEPVLVELEPRPSGEEQEEPEKAAKTRAPKADDVDPGVASLQTQLADMQRARETDSARQTQELADARRDAAEARQSVADTEADLVANGLQSAQEGLKSARAAYKLARDTGDTDAEADAMERIGRLSGDIREFERAAAVQSQREKAPPVAEQPKTQDFNTTLNAMNLLPAERDWFTKHPDALVDAQKRVHLDSAYFAAMDRKLVRGSPEYFDFVEDRLGYKQPEPREEQERTPIVSAPVSRDSRSASTGKINGNPNQVTLSPQEREMARNMGLSDIAYAKGKQQLEAAKSSDPEKFYRR